MRLFTRSDGDPSQRRRRAALRMAALLPAVGLGLVGGMVVAGAVVTSPTPQWQPNLHQVSNSVLTVCQDGNWDSDQLGSYQVEMGKWHNISSNVPTYTYVGTNCTSVSGKLWMKRPGFDGGSTTWRRWSHGRQQALPEEVSPGAA